MVIKYRKEHYDAIKNYDKTKIGGVILCSSCDSFLLLISELFEVNIKHLYLNVRWIIKKKAKKTLKLPNKVIFGN